jgi:hypothetical protein
MRRKHLLPTPSERAFASRTPINDIQLVGATQVSADYFNFFSTSLMLLRSSADSRLYGLLVSRLKNFETYEFYLRKNGKLDDYHTKRTQNQKDLLSLTSEFADLLKRGSIEVAALKKYAVSTARIVYGEEGHCYLSTVSMSSSISDEGIISLS